jgi:signal transduction histidine kinase
MAQLQNLLTADRGITARLRELERVLRPHRAENDGTLSSVLQREVSSSSGSLPWKIELLSQLQTELSSLYAFDQTLLESMQEALAVFANDGRLVFRNPRWQSFCERHGWNPSLRLEEFAAELDEPAWDNLRESLAQPGARLNAEVHIEDGLWQLTAVRLKAIEPGNPSRLILVVATDQTARLERDRGRAEALGFVTHELRTPLVSIQGFAEYLLRYPEKAGKSEAATTIFRECGRLVAMINTYLDVLRLESGTQPLKRELIQVRDLVAQVNRVIQPLAEAAEIAVSTEIASSLPSLEGDPNLIAGALLNLMSNAVKYSPRGSSIKLRALTAEGSVVLEVCNPGPIIPPGELQRLFEPFYRRQEQETSASGWGLGLAFVKRIAEQHGGQVEASSDPMTGTCFRLRLPVTRVHFSEVLQ